jgi:hypothetical protein
MWSLIVQSFAKGHFAKASADRIEDFEVVESDSRKMPRALK